MPVVDSIRCLTSAAVKSNLYPAVGTDPTPRLQLESSRIYGPPAYQECVTVAPDTELPDTMLVVDPDSALLPMYRFLVLPLVVLFEAIFICCVPVDKPNVISPV